jgi:hypothetical protein
MSARFLSGAHADSLNFIAAWKPPWPSQPPRLLGQAETGNIGDVQVAQGHISGALYGDGLAIIDRLATSDPGNAGCQRDLSVAAMHIGDAEAGQRDLPGAEKVYRDKSFFIAWRDLSNAGRQRDIRPNAGRRNCTASNLRLRRSRNGWRWASMALTQAAS